MWEWDNRVRWVALVVVAALLFGAGIKYERWRQGKEMMVPIVEKGGRLDLAADTEGKVTPKEEETLKVHVAGAVERPGVYQLPAKARVAEAVQLAGLLPEANVHALNLAAPLIDGQQIIVPRAGEEEKQVSGSPGDRSRSKVNINRAGVEELITLPGIGPALAQRILDYREQHGPFRSIEDIQNVSGIGPKRFQELKDLISVY